MADLLEGTIDPVAAPQTIDEPIAPEAVVVEGEKPAEENVEGGNEPEKEKKEPEKKNHDARRFERLLRERAEYKAKAELYEKQFGGNENHASQPASGRPQKDQFASNDLYIEALTDYNEKLVNDLPERANREAEDKQRDGIIEKAVVEIRKVYPDYDDVIADNADLQFHPDVIKSVRQADNSPEIAYYLGTHREEAERISELSARNPLAAIKAIGVIEDRLINKAKPVVKASAAPEPRKSVGSRGTVEKDPEKMSMKEFAEYETQRMAKLNQRK